eukprot:scaffold27034_cov171-Amphora_coffeaeformis.AAC.4
MGNRSSSTAVNPAAPPPLLSAAVTGDAATFAALWKDDTNNRLCQDRQDNNVLHALFACRAPSGKPSEILKLIHETLSTIELEDVYQARNQLGCNPLWILVAYGNVELLKLVLDYSQDDDSSLQSKLPKLVVQPNHQGDTPILATSSQGNTNMVKFLAASGLLNAEQFQNLLKQGNKKGTTPLQIVVANGHEDMLQFLLSEQGATIQDQLWHVNAADHAIAHDEKALEKILALTDKNGANPLHVAGFCGNAEIVQVWVDRIIAKQGESGIPLLDRTDGQGRTAYWISMVQSHEETIGKVLAKAGVATDQPEKMIEEIKQARDRRAARQQTKPAIDGNALLGR